MEYFQDDLFPDTRVWWEPALTSDQWFTGKNGAQKRLSLRPADMKPCKLYVISKPCLDKMNIMELRVNGLIGFLLMHTCDFTHKKSKRPHASHEPKSLRDAQGLVLLMHLCNHFGNPHVFYRPAIVSTQGICPPRKHYVTFFSPQGRSQPIHCLLDRKKKTDVDPCEISGPKESVFKSKWLYEFSWLMYISTNNQMKFITRLDAY